MQLPSPKELKKLAAACRAAGITSFKGGGIEFTLSDEAPTPSAYKRAKAAQVFVEQGEVENEGEPTPEELLLWSVGGGLPIEADPAKAE